MQDFEKLGAFYLGKAFVPLTATANENLLLYDATTQNSRRHVRNRVNRKGNHAYREEELTHV